MASFGCNPEVWENYSVKNIIKVQACVRRWLVKNKVKEIKRLYTNLVIALDGKETEIIWPRETLSCPSVRKVNKAAEDLIRIKESSSVSHSCNHEVRQLPANKDITSFPDSPISLNMECSTVKQQNSMSAEVQSELPCNDLVLTKTSKSGLQLSPNMEDNSLKQQNFVSTEVQTELPYTHLDERPGTNSGNLFDKALNQPSQCLADTTENTISNMSTLNLNYGENKSPRLQNSVIELVLHSGAQVSSERLHPDNGDGETYDKIVGTNKSIAQCSGVISESDKASQQAMSIQKEVTISRDLPDDKELLLQLKSITAMELLWIQQAINSRKNYLRLKQGLQ